MPKFGASIYGISRLITKGELCPIDAVTWMCENGCEVIEIVPFGIDLLSNPTLAGKMRRAAEKFNVAIDNYSLNADILLKSESEYKDEVARIKSHILAARDLGITTFRCDCAGYRRPLEKNTIDMFISELPLITQTYEELAEFTERLDIKLLLENHGFHINGSDRMQLVLNSVKSSNLGFQLDVGNFICMDESPLIATKKMMPWASTIHLKDFYVRQNDPGDATQFDCSGAWFRSVGGQYLRGSIMGQGDFDMIAIIKHIKQTGFDGNIYVEYEGMEECFYGVRVSVNNLKRIYNEV